MPARLTGLPFLALFLWSVYRAWETEDSLYVYPMLFSALVLALGYVFSPQINWWYYTRWTPALDKPVKMMLQRFSPFYNSLSESDRSAFEKRLFLTVTNTDFMLQALPSLPEDIRYMVAYPQVVLHFRREDWRCQKIEKTVIYPHPFPSPEHPTLHTSEWFAEDGVLIYALPKILEGFAGPGKVYNVVFHEQAKVFRECHPELSFPALEQPDIWEKLTAISGMSKSNIEASIGLEQTDLWPVCVHHFFHFPETFQRVLPELFSACAKIFNTVVKEH